jgi:hypothetical protein
MKGGAPADMMPPPPPPPPRTGRPSVAAAGPTRPASFSSAAATCEAAPQARASFSAVEGGSALPQRLQEHLLRLQAEEERSALRATAAPAPAPAPLHQQQPGDGGAAGAAGMGGHGGVAGRRCSAQHAAPGSPLGCLSMRSSTSGAVWPAPASPPAPAAVAPTAVAMAAAAVDAAAPHVGARKAAGGDGRVFSRVLGMMLPPGGEDC